MPDFLKTWGALIVAAIALIQPWLVAAWRKYFKRLTIEVYEAGTMEIGLSTFGPTIGLQGTVRAVNRDAFIRGVTLKIVREKDKAEHKFQWGVFRPPTSSPQQQVQFEICSGFLLSENAPRRLNIVFFESATVDEMRPHIDLLRQSWSKKIAESPIQVYFEQAQPSNPLPEDIHRFFQETYRNFSKEKICVDTFTTLNQMFYWEPGLYHAYMQIRTSRPNMDHNFSWRFEIKKENAELLRSNVIKIIMEACGQPTGGYSFVFPSYMD